MRAKRGASGLSGVLLIDKPKGLTSHDVIDRVRRASTERRVGHAGTLDPMATGLLVVLLGPATRLEPYLSGKDKRYDARITFGTATDTLDATGRVTQTASVSQALSDPAFAAKLLDGFIGVQLQTPPTYSAIKRDGKTAHRVARAGGEMVIEPREVTVHEVELVAIGSDSTGATIWDVALLVSKGTYVRSLAADIAEAAGTVGHLSALRRTGSGPLDVTSAHTLERVSQAAQEPASGIATLFNDPIDALGLPVTDGDPAVVTAGRALSLPARALGEGAVWGIESDGRLLALYRETSDHMSPCVVLATPIERMS